MNLVATEMEPGSWGVDHVEPNGTRWGVCECGHGDADTALACARESLEEHGWRAFEAYNRAVVGGVTWDGKPIPGWDAVTEKVREGWRTAAFAVREGAPL